MRRLLLLCVLVTACGKTPSSGSSSKKTTPSKTAGAKSKSKRAGVADAEGRRPPADRTAPGSPAVGAKPSAGLTKPLADVEKTAGAIAHCSNDALVFPFWPGEYPSPALQTDGPVTAKVAEGPCAPATRSCTFGRSLLHPWAQPADRGAVQDFAVRTMPSRYRATKDVELGQVTIPKGDTVTVLTYLAEGFCQIAWKGQPVEEMCPGNGGAAEGTWQPLDKDAPDVQFVRVACDSGKPGWLPVTADTEQVAGVRPALLFGYGEVARAK